MIDYVCPKIDGELFYSRMVRTLALDGESNDDQRAARVLGRKGRDIGVLLPSHADTLLTNLPALAGVTKDELFTTTLFPAAAVVLNPEERNRLTRLCRRSSPPANMRCLSGRHQAERPLRYCPDCARADAAVHRPLHWRTVHQHPGVTACAEHRTLLIEAPTFQRVPYRLFQPADWIDPTAARPPDASPIENRIAVDLRWLLVASPASPGRERLGRALHSLFHAHTKYRCDARSVQTEAVIDDLRAKHGDNVLLRLGGLPDPDDLWNWVRCCLYSCNQVGFERFTLLADLVNVSLSDLLDRANEMSAHSVVALPEASETERAKEKILSFISEHPGITRTQVYRGCAAACRLARRGDPAWYARALPARKIQRYVRRSENPVYDEKARDRLVVAYQHIVTTSARVGRTNLLQGARLKRFAAARRITLLPKTWAALESLIESDEEFARRRARAASAVMLARGEFCTFAQFKRAARLECLCHRKPDANAATKRAWEKLVNHLNGPTLFEGPAEILAA